jgi:hypothetical protein
MTCRNAMDDVETGGKVVAPGTSSGGALEPGPSGIRLGGGVNPDQALLWNAGTCRSDVKGEAQAGDPREGKSTDAGHRDGAVRSRDEGSVMELDRRGCGIPPRTGGQPVTGGATWPRQSCWTTKPTAGYWEPDEPRGSRPVLRERGGETPPRHSPRKTASRERSRPSRQPLCLAKTSHTRKMNDLARGSIRIYTFRDGM